VVALQHDRGRRTAMADAARARGRPAAAQAIARGGMAARGIA
jgi:hypothetical protein